MLEFKAEGLCRSANPLNEEELCHAMAGQEILQSTALAFDTQRRLHFMLAGQPALMEYEDCAEGAGEGAVRDIAILTRVGRPTCFVIKSRETDPDGRTLYRLSRTEAQRRCRAEYLDGLPSGSVIPCTVTHIEPFGAFCDVGCGISALLPIDCLSVSRISSPADRVSVGQQLLCAVKNRDPQGRLVLTLRELLGTWSENAACFSPGETVVGIVRSVEEYGVFIEIAPNLAGLAEAGEGLRPGQTVSVYIKNILPEKMKIKLVVVNKNVGSPLR
ncbi:MAG: 30S ribosomal protein S1, partial [Oscillospiraceae bacterium]|nr:30S ribosomal protein S1 [Oscillospiraceae bacterium]